VNVFLCCKDTGLCIFMSLLDLYRNKLIFQSRPVTTALIKALFFIKMKIKNKY